MRNISLDYTFLDETLYFAINFLDRYLSLVKVRMRKQYQLLALCCIYVAAKYHEEIKEPSLPDIVESATEPITIKEMKKMERKVLTVLSWNVNVVTPHVYFCFFFKKASPHFYS
jgi:hypothetical protein